MAAERPTIEHDGRSWTLFEAAHAARPELVKRLLAEGADVNARATGAHGWDSAAAEPSALNCALIAKAYDVNVAATVGVLIQRGATVDETHHYDFNATSKGGPESQAIYWMLKELAGGDSK